MSNEKTQQLSLPYEIIEKVVNRDYLRKEFDKVSTEHYLIPFEKLSTREGFNRTVFVNIEELASLMEQDGQIENLVVDVLPDGRIIIDQGERRYKAMFLNRSKGSTKFDFVKCDVNNSKVSELERAERVWTTNQGRECLHPVDQAQVIYRLKYLFTQKPLANETLAQRVGVSRQTIDNLLKVWEMPDNLKKDIRDGVLSVTSALDLERDKKKLQKQSDKAEEDSHKTSAAAMDFPKDELKSEMDELKALDIQAEQVRQREAEFEAKENERLQQDAVMVSVSVEELTKHIGKRLAKNADNEWSEDFTDEDTGEVVPVKRTVTVLKQGTLLDEATIDDLVKNNVGYVWMLKDFTIAKSVITELPGVEEKGKFDESRPEIAQIQNIIKLSDKIETMINKMDVSEGLKKDISDVVKWIQKDADELRNWVHSNKKQNKIR